MLPLPSWWLRSWHWDVVVASASGDPDPQGPLEELSCPLLFVAVNFLYKGHLYQAANNAVLTRAGPSSVSLPQQWDNGG